MKFNNLHIQSKLMQCLSEGSCLTLLPQCHNSSWVLERFTTHNTVDKVQIAYQGCCYIQVPQAFEGGLGEMAGSRRSRAPRIVRVAAKQWANSWENRIPLLICLPPQDYAPQTWLSIIVLQCTAPYTTLRARSTTVVLHDQRGCRI